MASAAENGQQVPSLGEDLEIADMDGPITFEEACLKTESLSFAALDVPIFVNKPAGIVEVLHLPLREIVGGTTLKYMIDIVCHFEGPIDKAAIEVCMKKGIYKMLPVPYKSKTEILVPYTLQIAARPEPDGKHTIVKHYTFSQKVNVQLLKAAAVGVAYAIEFGKNFRCGAKGFQYMFESLGGYQVRYFALKHDGPKRIKSSGELQAGFDFIRLRGPRSMHNNLMTEWTEIHINTEGTPIYGWNAGLVEKSLRNYAASNALAEPVLFYPLTLKDVSGWFLDDVLAPIVPHLLDHTVLFLGEPGRGKTVIAEILAQAFSLYHILQDGVDEEMSYKITSDLDFLRGEPGSKYRPAVLDDIDLQKQPIVKCKAVFASSEVKSMTYQRWGGTAFVQMQLRIVCDNKYDETAEPDIHAAGAFGVPAGHISHTHFMDMVRPAFNESARAADLMGIMKRTAVVVNTKKAVYVRLPGQDEVSVRRVKLDPKDKQDFIADECKEYLRAYKKGNKAVPPHWDIGLQWGQALLTKLLQTDTKLPRTHMINMKSARLTDKPEWKEVKPKLMNSDGNLCDTGDRIITVKIVGKARGVMKDESCRADVKDEGEVAAMLLDVARVEAEDRQVDLLQQESAEPLPVRPGEWQGPPAPSTPGIRRAFGAFKNLRASSSRMAIDLSDSPCCSSKKARLSVDDDEDFGDFGKDVDE
jgi:hypothetical protein